METQTLEIHAEQSIPLPRSKVAPAYKKKYAEREAAMQRRPKGLSRRALARCNGDWLAIELAKRVLGEKDRLNLEAFDEILALNGVENKWKHCNNGMQKMNGTNALRAVVAETEEIVFPDEEPVRPPRSWIAKYAR